MPNSLFSRIWRCSLSMVLALTCLPALAQEVEMADNFREDGKIYVVVAVLVIILIGLLAYLFWIDRKVSKLESQIEQDRQAD